MSLGFFIDNTAADDIASIVGSFLPMTNKDQIVDANYDIAEGLCTFEGNGIATALSSGNVTPSLSAMVYPPEVGLWSASISDENGNTDFTFTINLSKKHTSAFTIYTDGPNITSGYVKFSLNGVMTTVQLTCKQGLAVASGEHDYDSIEVTITSIDEPYKHIRIAEIEFGDSITIGAGMLAGKVTYIDEIDPLQVGMPMAELDLQLVNVLGTYDEDNPNSLYPQLAIGNPINLSYTITKEVEGATKRYTIPMGRLVIGEKSATGTRLNVVAYDTRFKMTQMYSEWGIDPEESLGDTLEALLTSLELAYDIDDNVYELYPESYHSFSSETTILSDLQTVAQAYGLYIKPNRSGVIVVSTAFPSDDYGEIPANVQYTWPESSQMNKYNYLDIAYGDGSTHYTRDLRTSQTVARFPLSIYNPLIVNEAMAISVADRIVSHIYTVATKVDWLCDPSADLYDEIDVYSRWTYGNAPATYKSLKREITYDGSLREVTTFVQ